MTEQPDLSAILGEASRPIEFSAGLIGLEEWHKFEMISHPAGGPLKLLQSLEDSRVSFIVADPRQIMPGYQLNLTRLDIEAVRYSGRPGPVPANEPDLGLYCILSVQEDPFKVTANLLGPLVINWQTGLARQVIQADSNYAPRYLVADQSTVAPAKEGK